VISRGVRRVGAHLLGERAVSEAGGERDARHCSNGLYNLSGTIHPRLGKCSASGALRGFGAHIYKRGGEMPRIFRGCKNRDSDSRVNLSPLSPPPTKRVLTPPAILEDGLEHQGDAAGDLAVPAKDGDRPGSEPGRRAQARERGDHGI